MLVEVSVEVVLGPEPGSQSPGIKVLERLLSKLPFEALHEEMVEVYLKLKKY
jgi:hypothetical protein